MGSSQSKFKPGPHDCWHKMKVTGSQPKYLQCALQAIKDLHESTGSSQGRIIDYIQGVINAKQIRPRPRNVAMQIKRALKYAAQNGMVNHRGGRYVLALSDKDFAIFKGLRPKDPIKVNVKPKKIVKTPKKSKRRHSKYTKKYKKYSRLAYDDSLEDARIKSRKRRRDYEDDFYSDLDSLSSFSDDEEPTRKKSKKSLNNLVKCRSKEYDNCIKKETDLVVKKTESNKCTKNIVNTNVVNSKEGNNTVKKVSKEELKKTESKKNTTNKIETTSTESKKEDDSKKNENENKPDVEVKKRKERKKRTKKKVATANTEGENTVKNVPDTTSDTK
ncbi:peptidyl-prolyl cis-trans isomerase G-like [Diabrotica virgifera virgifera]|uniref:Peptidyl-prolyl cis-trans isomerase G-like n=1 Tax=Diabrotica virgifera virgifera TaxID=50390 RepID=A0A6P7EYA3_DIAVI|nr:peptidyl-prolyl cis-trans isomerase G-like [Diabrotica virgifera virgifera]